MSLNIWAGSETNMFGNHHQSNRFREGLEIFQNHASDQCKWWSEKLYLSWSMASGYFAFLKTPNCSNPVATEKSMTCECVVKIEMSIFHKSQLIDWKPKLIMAFQGQRKEIRSENTLSDPFLEKIYDPIRFQNPMHVLLLLLCCIWVNCGSFQVQHGHVWRKLDLVTFLPLIPDCLEIEKGRYFVSNT